MAIGIFPLKRPTYVVAKIAIGIVAEQGAALGALEAVGVQRLVVEHIVGARDVFAARRALGQLGHLVAVETHGLFALGLIEVARGDEFAARRAVEAAGMVDGTVGHGASLLCAVLESKQLFALVAARTARVTVLAHHVAVRLGVVLGAAQCRAAACAHDHVRRSHSWLIFVVVVV